MVFQALKSVLAINLRSSGSGEALVRADKFVLTDLNTGRDLDLEADLARILHPGQRISMSIVIDRDEADESTSCPKCGATTPLRAGR